MISTVDPYLSQVVLYLDRELSEHVFNVDSLPWELRGLLSLHTLRLAEMAERGDNAGYKHWAPSLTAYHLMDLEELGLSRRAIRTGFHPNFGTDVDEADEWLSEHRDLLEDCFQASRHAQLAGAWRQIGTMLGVIGDRQLKFVGSENDGSWTLKITRRGELRGLGERDELVSFSLLGLEADSKVPLH